MITESMLTTFDNPYDPFDNFSEWFMFDIEKGYNSCSRLARFISNDESLSTVEADREREAAIDKIIDIDFLNIYTKVTKSYDNGEETEEIEHSDEEIDEESIKTED